MTIQSNSESTLIPQTELGDFVDINRDNFIDEGSGEEISKDSETQDSQDITSFSSTTLFPSNSTLEEILTGTSEESIWTTTTTTTISTNTGKLLIKFTKKFIFFFIFN
uniref:Uncharacterized protein n=1 Tax=Panagrolaimus sp. PS1159 TaxID=55785 RepID=A0AC35FVQ8_9BILA